MGENIINNMGTAKIAATVAVMASFLAGFLMFIFTITPFLKVQSTELLL